MTTHSTNASAAQLDVGAEWDYNPSAWKQRIPIIVLGIIGMSIAFYLASYQLGLVRSIWDPVFGSASTHHVLESKLSKMFPVSDALLGSIGYLIDWVFGAIGGEKRYRTMPWVVVIFGIGIVPFGGTSIFLALAMPTLVGSWCFLCLVNTVIAIVMIPMAWDEIWLSYRSMRRLTDQGYGFWEVFWGRTPAQR